MRRTLPVTILTCLAICLVPLATAHAQDNASKIANAMSAAPPSIANIAAVVDWPSEPGGAMATLKKGSSDWTCFPDNPGTPGNDPMCVDPPWLEWVDAWVNKREPKITAMGFGYMLQANDSPYSNTDPYFEGPTADNEWQETDVPHLMILVPDDAMLEGMSTDPTNGGPWVMWRDTPYVHIMAPMPLYTPSKH